MGVHTAILVDDGLATGATMRAAVAALRQKNPNKVVVAVPVAARASVIALRRTGIATQYAPEKRDFAFPGVMRRLEAPAS